MTDCVSEIGKLAQSAPTELRVRALETITQLLQVKVRSPGPELRVPALETVTQLLQVKVRSSGYSWGSGLWKSGDHHPAAAGQGEFTRDYW